MSQKITFSNVLFCTGSLKTKFLKIADYLIGGFLCRIISPQNVIEVEPQSVKRILVIRPGGLGDAILLIPFLKQVRKIFKDAEIDVIAEKRNKQVFELEQGLTDRIFCYDQFCFLFLFFKLRKISYDLVFDTEQWHNLSAIFSFSTKAKIRIGFDTRSQRSKFYTHLIRYGHKDYEADNFLNLLSPWEKVSKEISLPFLQVEKELKHWAENLLKSKRTAVLCLSAGIGQRIWPKEKFKELKKYLISKNFSVFFIGTKKKAEYNLKQILAILSSAYFYIGSDSGILHLAYFSGIPTISLFGSGIQEKWAPRGERHIAINKKLPCSPCTLFGYTPRCKNVACMKEISVEEVTKILYDRFLIR